MKRIIRSNDVAQGSTFSSGVLLNVIDNPMSMVNKQYVDSMAEGAGFAPGDIKLSSSSNSISGFLRCNGSILNVNSFLPLFNAIGQNFNQRLLIGSGVPHRCQHEINTRLNGVMRQWNVNSPNLPIALSKTSLLVTNSRIYLIGNRNATAPENNVRTTTFNEGGVFGAWSNQGTIPSAITFCQSVVFGGRFYLLGGENATPAGVNSVFNTTIAANGIIGTWNTLTNMPFSVSRGQAIVTTNLVYIIGGSFNNTISNRVVFSTIQSNGTLTAWTDAPNLPIPLNMHSVAVVGNRVYVIGGQTTGNVYSNRVFVSTIDSTGHLGNWSDVHNYPLAVIDTSTFVSRDKVYVIGGQTTTAGARTADIYSAIILPDGSLGSWQVAGPYAAAVAGGEVMATAVSVVVLGGSTSNTAATNIIRSFPTTGGLNDYTELNNNVFTANDPSTFRIPDYSHLERNNLFAFIKT